MLDRVKRVRWLQVPFLGKPHMTEDERIASVACCPCYFMGGGACALLGAAALVIAVGVAGPPFIVVSFGASAVHQCFGRDLSKRWWEREAWFEPEPKAGPALRNGCKRTSRPSSPVTLVKDIETVD